MSKTYSIIIGANQFRVTATDAAQAVKLAIRAWQDGREEPDNLKLSVETTKLPAVQKVG